MTYLDDLFSLENKIAVVTGAARGNGLAISTALLKAGCKVILVDINANQLKNTINSLQSEHNEAYEFVCDISNIKKIFELKKFVETNFKKIDILINNAGVTFSHETLDYPEDLWEKTYQTNLKGPFNLVQIFGKLMKNQKSGVIINITSINSELAFPDNPAYQSMKGALKQLTKSLALDLGNWGIRVNNVGPGYFHTDMTKQSWEDLEKRNIIANRTILGRWGTPDDLAGLIVFLASDSSSYITGQDLYVDGGWTTKGI